MTDVLIAYAALSVFAALFLYMVCVRPTPIEPDVMDEWVTNRLDIPMEVDPDSVFDLGYIQSGLCQCDDCQAKVDEDYPT